MTDVINPEINPQHINTRENLHEEIHKINVYLLRTNVLNTLDILQIFNLYYLLYRIEQYNLFKVLQISTQYRLSKLYLLASTKDPLFQSVLKKQLNELNKHNTYIKISEKHNLLNTEQITYLINGICKILQSEKILNLQLSGKIYEYFINQDSQQIKEYGAYFTDKHLTDFILNQIMDISLSPTGQIYSICDPFGGSACFISSYIALLNNKYPNLDWSKNIDKIHYMDINPAVIIYFILEVISQTGLFPNRDNFKCADAFMITDNKYDICVSNPPYGGSSTNMRINPARVRNNKICNYITNLISETSDIDKLNKYKQQIAELTNKTNIKPEKKVNTKGSQITDYCKLYNLKCNDKESKSMILLMAMAKPDAQLCVVMKNGFFFNKKYKAIRKHLICNMNVISISDLSNDQFENTGVHTKILYFRNNGRTQTVDFNKIEVEKYTQDEFYEDENNMIHLTHQEGEFKQVNRISIQQQVPVSDICKKDYLLIGSEYKTCQVTVNFDYEMKKLKDIYRILPNTLRYSGDKKTTGRYPYYTSGKTVYRCDIPDYNKLSVLINGGGNTNYIYLDDHFGCSSHNIVITAPDPILVKFLYYLLKYNGDEYLTSKRLGSTDLKHLSRESVLNMDLYWPKSYEKIKELVDLCEHGTDIEQIKLKFN